jgi:ornithine cyclodeaminase/alanine dehydrogenase-like protein (mu-crystallin family)
LQMIDAARVHELLEYEQLVEALKRAHLGPMPAMSDRRIYSQPLEGGNSDVLILLPAWQPQEGMLVKLVTSFPRNKARFGLPTVNSLYVSVNGATGVPEAIFDGEAVIFRKTSADSALGASILAREDAKTLLMIGSGGLAPYLVRAHCTVRPSIRDVLIWNRTPSTAAKLAGTLAAEGIPANQVSDLDQAVPRADIISCATMATSPLLKGRLLAPGVHVDLVGSFTPEMREADDDVLLRGKVFVDHRQITERSGEFIGPFARGIITPDDVRGDMFQLCQGKIDGRVSDNDITVMKNGGGSYLDYFVTRYLMSRLVGEAAAQKPDPARS